jgi:hypothetical protein
VQEEVQLTFGKCSHLFTPLHPSSFARTETGCLTGFYERVREENFAKRPGRKSLKFDKRKRLLFYLMLLRFKQYEYSESFYIGLFFSGIASLHVMGQNMLKASRL